MPPPATQISLGDFRAAAAAFIETYPHSAVFEGHFDNYFFFGSDSPLRFDLQAYSLALQSEPVARTLARIGYRGNPSLPLAGFICLGRDLRPFIRDAPLTDDTSALEFSAWRERGRSESAAILELLLRAEKDLFETIAPIPEGRERLFEAARADVARYRQSRQERARMLRAIERADARAAMEYGEKAFARAPDDPRLYSMARQAASAQAARLRQLGDPGRAAELEAALRRMAQVQPINAPGLSIEQQADRIAETGAYAAAQGDWLKAERNLRAALTLEPDRREARARLANVLSILYRGEEALATLQPLLGAEALPAPLRAIAVETLAREGRTREALAQLDQAIDEGFEDLSGLARSPRLDDFRASAEFRALLERRGLALPPTPPPTPAPATPAAGDSAAEAQ